MDQSTEQVLSSQRLALFFLSLYACTLLLSPVPGPFFSSFNRLLTVLLTTTTTYRTLFTTTTFSLSLSSLSLSLSLRYIITIIIIIVSLHSFLIFSN